ncbi:phage holin family protein [Falsiroseomonas selenitidurans]|uniref:Phage holin family protein n=1 Tax=Falsiroseomonas selenitidurans TaxID=2716335 RepID=A0ABX1E1U4_9PROT|nr:phage holin family protein [Falsiroseomonas selenitidurans]NKC31053.1 phage holin family protein [Falsiroseomonas selenitidurans]
MPQDFDRAPERLPERDRSLPELFGTFITQISTLFRQEIQLARAEMGERARDAGGAITPLAAGAGMLLGTLILLLFALVSLLVHFDVPVGWARLIVAILAAIIGYALIRGGLSKLDAARLVPQRTAQQLARDAQVAREQMR